MNIRSLFKTTVDPQEIPNPVTYQAQHMEPEDWHSWGLKVCAIVDGGCYALVPYLHRVYNHTHNEQIENEAWQEQQRKNIECQIEQKRTDIGVLNEQLKSSKQKQIDNKNLIVKLNEDKTELKNKAYEVNKAAKMKLILGLVILIPLTFYLFLFYSSTFYSAFFKDFGSSDSVLNSMFDAEALSKALETSVTELCFVLCAPIIFMGLGFSLHFFTIQKSWTKYLKMAAILCITFLFDAILAYMIGKHLHEMEIIIGSAPLGSPYGLSEALTDINTWAVIFCGFIVYVIWGIVFDMSMSAYDQLDLNKINGKALDEKIAMLEMDISNEKQHEQDLNLQIAENNKDIASLTAQMNSQVIIDKSAIRANMTAFFAGWMSQMNVFGKSDEEQHNANSTFEQTLTSLLN